MRDLSAESAMMAPDSASTSSTEGDDPNDDISMDVWMGTDPFYDRFPWFRLVGRSGNFLNVLTFQMCNTSIILDGFLTNTE